MVRNQKEWRGVATPSPDIVRRLGMIFLHDFTLLIYFLKHFGILVKVQGPWSDCDKPRGLFLCKFWTMGKFAESLGSPL
jgi:hypothetical protein